MCLCALRTGRSDTASLSFTGPCDRRAGAEEVCKTRCKPVFPAFQILTRKGTPQTLEAQSQNSERGSIDSYQIWISSNLGVVGGLRRSETCEHNMPPGLTWRWAYLAPATLVVVLCVGLVCRHSHGPSLLLEKLSGSIGGKAEPGIPRTWISDKDMADSPMLHSSSSSASLPGQGILSSAMHPERISLASAPPSGALAAAQRRGRRNRILPQRRLQDQH